MPPADCVLETWFCNAEGSCRCDAALARPADGMVAKASPKERSPGTHVTGKKSDGLPCMCAGASVSEPEGGCPAANWFCNRSGLCRCDL